MSIFNQLELGYKYSKKDLSVKLDEGALINVREGVYGCKQSASYLLFVDLEKSDKESRFHFNDYFEGDFFHWDSQTTQHINSPRIQQVVKHELEVHLFVRKTQKIKSITQPFIYCGRLKYLEHDTQTAKPVHIIFQNSDYDDFSDIDDLIDIYLWRPAKAGMTSSAAISKEGVVSSRRKSNYRPPTKTERTGLVTSRVGQGYFRNQLFEKFNSRCAVTGSSLQEVLIASHIVPWSESTETQRLDVNNGLLLSPLYDALFDKHLISFSETGRLLVGQRVKDCARELNIAVDASIDIDPEMEVYLKRHRRKLM